jgi:hypothetical protein
VLGSAKAVRAVLARAIEDIGAESAVMVGQEANQRTV